MIRKNMIREDVLRIVKLLAILPVIILYIHYFFPQRWGFFILKPRSSGINIYPISDGKAIKDRGIHNNMSYGLGTSRKGRFYYKELSRLIDENKNLSWRPLADSQTSFVNEPYTLIASNKFGFKPGQYLITRMLKVSDSFIINSNKITPAKQYSLAEIR